jgi:hypothetical protein
MNVSATVATTGMRPELREEGTPLAVLTKQYCDDEPSRRPAFDGLSILKLKTLEEV